MQRQRTIMAFYKVCSEDIRRARLKLKVNADVVNVVYSELFDSLLESYADHPFSSWHNYLSDEPAFVCKACFVVFKNYCDVKASIQSLKQKLQSSYGETARKVSYTNSACMRVQHMIIMYQYNFYYTVWSRYCQKKDSWCHCDGRRGRVQRHWQERRLVTAVNDVAVEVNMLSLTIYYGMVTQCFYCQLLKTKQVSSPHQLS